MDRPLTTYSLFLPIAALASAAAFFLVNVTFATQDLSDYHWPRRIAVLPATASTVAAVVEWRLLKCRVALSASILFALIAVFVMYQAVALG